MKALALLIGSLVAFSQASDDAWLTWPAARAEGIAKAAYEQGRVGGWFDTRILSTDRAYNYKLAATWMHHDVIRATARVLQLTERLTDEEARVLVAEAEAAAPFVVMVEIDPREGSGVIPNDWSAYLQPLRMDGSPGKAVRGTAAPKLRDVRTLAGVRKRNYDYDRYWLTFPDTHQDGTPLVSDQATHLELAVRIAGSEGRVKWPIPALVKAKLPRK